MAKIIIIMGVSGCGKTTIGKRLATVLALPFFDADNFHPKENIEKMKQNIPLDDADRMPWLLDLAKHIKEWSTASGAILACSALKESYRTLLATHYQNIQWIFLEGSFEIIQKRLAQREDHFMKATLLQSQFDTLEVPSYGIKINIEQDQETMVSEIIEKLNTHA